MAVSDLKEAMHNTRDMDCYLEARSAGEIIQDISEALAWAADTATLRDHFAAQALVGLLAGQYRHVSTYNLSELPAEAFKIAEAMVEERSVASALSEQDR